MITSPHILYSVFRFNDRSNKILAPSIIDLPVYPPCFPLLTTIFSAFNSLIIGDYLMSIQAILISIPKTILVALRVIVQHLLFILLLFVSYYCIHRHPAVASAGGHTEGLSPIISYLFLSRLRSPFPINRLASS